jgi:hypothetical protein
VGVKPCILDFSHKQSWSTSRSSRFIPQKEPAVVLIRKFGGPQSQSGRNEHTKTNTQGSNSGGASRRHTLSTKPRQQLNIAAVGLNLKINETEVSAFLTGGRMQSCPSAYLIKHQDMKTYWRVEV